MGSVASVVAVVRVKPVAELVAEIRGGFESWIPASRRLGFGLEAECVLCEPFGIRARKGVFEAVHSVEAPFPLRSLGLGAVGSIQVALCRDRPA